MDLRTTWLSACLLGCASATPPASPGPSSDDESTQEADTVGAADPDDDARPRRRQTAARPELLDEDSDDRGAASPRVSALDKTPLVGPAPTIRITRPRDGRVIPAGRVELALAVQHWPLSGPPGNHVHVKVDNGEELALHDVSEPLDLDALYEERHGEPLGEGTHVLRVFLSRPNHEGLKVPSAFAMVVFHYVSRTPGFTLDRSRPLLTYSRPQGCASDPSRLLDFQITRLNDLSHRGYRVRYVIDGVHRGYLEGWRPYRIDDLSQGDHTIRLTLLAPSGAAVPGPFNDTTRTIRVDRSCEFLGLLPADADEDQELAE